MRRAVTFGIAWLTAAVIAAVIAWQGVGVVDEQVTDDRPAPLQAAEVAAALAAATTSTAPATEPPAGHPGTSTTLPGGSTETVGSTPLAAPTTATTAPNPAPAAVPPTPTTTVPASAPAAAETRTYNLVGGSAALRFDDDGTVTVVWATPNAGFTVDTGNEGSGVRVEFESDAHRSRVDGWWDDGPRDEVREEPR
jgi:hypothetical protein